MRIKQIFSFFHDRILGTIRRKNHKIFLLFFIFTDDDNDDGMRKLKRKQIFYFKSILIPGLFLLSKKNCIQLFILSPRKFFSNRTIGRLSKNWKYISCWARNIRGNIQHPRCFASLLHIFLSLPFPFKIFVFLASKFA